MKPKRKKNYSLKNLRFDKASAIRYQKILDKIVYQQTIFTKIVYEYFSIK